jgi:hypothetical protein
VNVARENANTVVVGPPVRLVFAEAPFHRELFRTIEGTVPYTYTAPGNVAQSGQVSPDAIIIHATGGTLHVFDTDYSVVHQPLVDSPREQVLRQKLVAQGITVNETGHGRNGSVAVFQAAYNVAPTGDINAGTTPTLIDDSYQAMTTRFPAQG